MSDRSTAALAVATVALVPSIYSAALPTMAEVRAQADDRGHIAAAETYAAMVSAAVVLAIAGLTRSPEAAGVGLVAVVAFAGAYTSARRCNP